MNLTKTQIVLAGALVVIAVSVPAWQQTRIDRLTAEARRAEAQVESTTQLQAEVARLRAQAPDPAELERLRGAESELKLEVARLRNELGTVKRAASSAPAAAAPTAEPATNAKPVLPTAMAVAMKAAVEQQTVGKLLRLKPRLNLTPEQEEGVRAILTRQAEQATAVAEKMFSGKLSREEMTSLQKGSTGDPEGEIKALLTPEQLTAYAEFKQEENVSNARLVANAELLQMQAAVGLTQEQQDKVYNALYDYTVDTLNGKLGDIPPGMSDPAAAMNWQFDRKVKALEPVLTPEQLEAYRKIQESQRKMIEGFLPAKVEPPQP
jgi:hypothetical protein